MMTKDSAAEKIDVREHLDELFALDVKVAKATPSLLPLESKEAFLDFLIKEHKSENWVWRNSEGRMISYLSLVDKPAENSLEILNIGVDPDMQRSGYGRRMMEFAEDIARQAGREKTTLVTNTKNIHAVAFYRDIGYLIVKEMPNYYGDGETRYLFEKQLQ
ncbi:MAG: GNAT family N-acetyltransferase [Candidatus Micrarchaeota archaeon]|nr:GNAT family N-acetyltransferase [Candidatus Micrarchaeota archaeon]